jgi:TRAP-type C4-dicarboxylate transport system substrate-binding protein
MEKIMKVKRISRRDFLKNTGKCLGATIAAGTAFHIPKIVWGSRILKPIVVATPGKPGMPVYNSYAMLPRVMEEKYGIKVDIQIHHSGSFGSSVDNVDAAINGTVDLAADSQQNFSTFSNAFAWACLPYVIKNVESAEKLLESPLMKELKERIERELKGAIMYTIRRDGGYRILWNNERELRVPEDLRGMKIRATNSPVSLALKKAWGASPVPISFSEVYTSVEQGLVKGIHTQAMWFAPFSFYEVMKYGTEVQAIYAMAIHIVNGKTWKSWPKDIQDAFMDAARETTKQTNKQDEEEEVRLKKLCQEKGVKIYMPTSDEYNKWRSKAITIWKDAAQYGVDTKFLQKVLEFQGISVK